MTWRAIFLALLVGCGGAVEVDSTDDGERSDCFSSPAGSPCDLPDGGIGRCVFGAAPACKAD